MNAASTVSLAERLEQFNDQAFGRCCDELEYSVSEVWSNYADIRFRDGGYWVGRVPGDAASLEILEAIASATRIGRALGRTDGKREIGDFLRRECGL